uniref:Uncharacterized protein n=1 Tax=Oryza sativa subsp. japonica TaxID=39947 RepID=Q6K637_ORYSJ|nr:hypothetical protein [Oryza sativa Japonica Group]
MSFGHYFDGSQGGNVAATVESLGGTEIFWRGGALQGLAACSNQGAGRGKTRLISGSCSRKKIV